MEIISELPDRLCVEQGSPYFSASCALVGLKVDGSEQPDTVEYCVSGGWVRVGIRADDGSLERNRENRRLFETNTSNNVKVEPYWRYQPSRQVLRQMQRELSK